MRAVESPRPFLKTFGCVNMKKILVADIDGTEYIYNFHSNQKPNDYYTSYYCAMKDFSAPGFNLFLSDYSFINAAIFLIIH
mgnify:CR=1 FL=1